MVLNRRGAIGWAIEKAAPPLKKICPLLPRKEPSFTLPRRISPPNFKACLPCK